LNLLNNGLRFTDQGYVALRVERQENALLISVRDTGSGIAPEDLPRVFEEFRQVGEENWRRRAGSGLGLHISRQFVELHGGTMGVESTLGEGTLFYFTLPLTPAHYDLSTAPSGAPAPPPQPPVLLLSSDAEELSTLQHFLDEYRLHPAESPEEALLKARQLFPRAILLSGEVDPLPAGQLPYDLPIIRFLLPRPFLQDHKIHAYLVKPLSRQKLLQTLQSLGKPEARLLIIDDDPAMIRFIQQSCRAAGQAHYTLFSALSAAQADEILACQPIDAIMLDLELPDMHGVEWLKAFRARPAMESVPVIIISAQDAPTGLLSPGRPALELFLRHSLPPNVLAEFIKVALEKIPPQYP
jgi:CheY-like chemotaxis protein